MRWTPIVVLPFVVALSATRAFASPKNAGDVDTSYGRFDSGVSLAVGAGGSVATNGARIVADTRIRYVDTAGLFVTYESAVGVSPHASEQHILAAGIELRPLFLSRWALGLGFGSRYLDLFIDSLALEMGPYWALGNEKSRPGFQTGVGLGFPVFGHVTGLLIGFHAGVRWPADAFLHGNGAPPEEPFAILTIGWQQPIALRAMRD